jgi:hypothetical protein
MKQMLQSLNESSGANWQLFGEIELPIGPLTDEAIQTWMVETLRPLNLNARFLEKILASAQQAAKRDFASADGKASGCIHLLIFTPRKSPTNGQTWGFFRMEKTPDPPAEHDALHHTIAFYLYLEGR